MTAVTAKIRPSSSGIWRRVISEILPQERSAFIFSVKSKRGRRLKTEINPEEGGRRILLIVDK
jgi:hypothetical protein